MNPLQKELPSSLDIPLHDIKPLVEVPDHSLLLSSLLLLLIILLLSSLLYLGWHHLRHRKKVDKRGIAYKALKSVSFDEPKRAAYAITKYGRVFSQEGPRYKEAYADLLERLAPYKYKKVVTPIDEETIAFYRIYVEMIDV